MIHARHTPLTAFLVGMIGIATFSGMDAVMKGLVIALGIYATMVWRMLAGVAMAGALFATRPNWPARDVMRIHLFRGALITVMGLLFFWGLARVPMAQAIALTFIAPLIALILAALFLGERIGRRSIVGSLAAFAGVALIVLGQARAELGREALIGSIAILLSAICYAGNIVLMRRQALAAKPLEISFFQNLTVAVLLAASIPFLGAPAWPGPEWGWIIVAAMMSFAGILLFAFAYARAEASYLAVTEYSAFLWAAALGWAFFDEGISLFTVAGAALIVAGCIVASRLRHDEAAPAMEVAA